MFRKKTLTVFRHPDLYFEQVQDKGHGVFCLQNLKKDELLEVVPLLIFPGSQAPHLAESVLPKYLFKADKLPPKYMRSLGIDDPEKTSCLPMGIASICKTEANPNTAYRFEVDDLSPYIIVTAARDILKGEEISVSLGNTGFAPSKDSSEPA